MAVRSVGLGAMFGWVGDTFRLLGRNTGALMGASVINLVIYFALMLPMFAYMFSGMFAGGLAANAASAATAGTGFWLAYAFSTIGALLVFPPMMVGWFRLARAVDLGQPARASDLLAPYRDRQAWLRGLALSGIMMLACLALFAVFAGVFWSAIQEFMANAAAQQAARLAGTVVPPALPPMGLVLGYLFLILLMIFAQLAYLVAFADVSLGDRGVVAALREACTGVLRNSGKLLVFWIAMSFVGMVAAIILALVLGVVVAVLSTAGAFIAIAAMVLLYIPFLLLLYPVMFGGCYFVWKSMLSDGIPEIPGGQFRDDVLTA